MPHPDENPLGAFDPSSFQPEWTADGHVSEDSIHAWLDRAMDARDSQAVEEHVRVCVACEAAVAEARGFIAASMRIVHAAEVSARHVISHDDIARAAARLVSDAPESPVVVRSLWRSRTVVSYAAGFALMLAGTAYFASRNTKENIATAPASRVASATVAPTDSTVSPVRSPDISQPAESVVAPSRSVTAPSVADRSDPDAQAKVVETPPASPAIEPALVRRNVADVAASPPARREVVDAAAISAVTVSGRVTDGTRPLANASVSVPGRAIATVTDSLGRYTLRNVPSDATALLARHIGYSASSLRIAGMSPDSATVNFALTPATMALSQVVVSSAKAFTFPENARCLIALVDTTSDSEPLLRMLRGDIRGAGAYTLTLLGWPNRDARTDASFVLDSTGTLTGRASSGNALIAIELHADGSSWFGTLTETRANSTRREDLEFRADTSALRCARNE
jgi:hypothetical protein